MKSFLSFFGTVFVFQVISIVIAVVTSQVTGRIQTEAGSSFFKVGLGANSEVARRVFIVSEVRRRHGS